MQCRDARALTHLPRGPAVSAPPPPQGTPRAVLAAVRSLPQAILQPARGIVEALSAVLLGARNTLDSTNVEEPPQGPGERS